MKDKTHKHTFKSLMEILKKYNFEFILEGKQIRVSNKKLNNYINVNEKIDKDKISPYIIKPHKKEYKKYLKNLVGCYLDKENQIKLLNVSNSYFNLDKDIKTISKLNEHIKEFNFEITTDRITVNGKKITVWKVNNI